ncbi:phage major tail protein, TP901-1 family [Clostridium felsineum]|uniref:phage major tail protein, TP901-1 family n=1 Tax=Clostridium felsineum TaxID=36839 RepID=UPI00098C9CC3|nr:phage major tail protein, TP901-1 family [Clostridium felsineum]URZ16860.1 hypothetical protein CLFE_029070 [Clostridium felsineum DSM 794]
MANVAGVDVILKVDVSGTMTAVGGQKGASLKRSAKTIDVTDKNSNAWAKSIPGVKSWSIECDGFVMLGDTALTALHTAFDSRTAIEVEIRIGANADTAGYTYTGTAVLTEFPEEYSQDDAVTYKLTLEGASPLVRTVGVVS